MKIRNWLMKQACANNEGSIAQKMRRRRIEIFEIFFKKTFWDKLNKGDKIEILDIGGTIEYWEAVKFKYLKQSNITLLNLEVIEIPKEYSNMNSVKGNAINLKQYDDNEFMFCFSNSVIEHVGDYHAQKKMAKEILRVGEHGYLQTPNKYFCIEPHFLFPFFQFLPVRIKVFLLMHFDIGNYQRTKNKQKAYEAATEIRLLSLKEMKKLFPGIEIYKENIGPFVKSFYLFW